MSKESVYSSGHRHVQQLTFIYPWMFSSLGFHESCLYVPRASRDRLLRLSRLLKTVLCSLISNPSWVRSQRLFKALMKEEVVPAEIYAHVLFALLTVVM